MKPISIDFKDKAIFDGDPRTVVSVRDGVQKYYGAELGMEPPDKQFTIYRGPETITECAKEMEGLPLTDGHVPLDTEPTANLGKVLTARVLPFVDPVTNSTVKVKNDITLDNPVENRELSLGYNADLVDCDLYDFEQVNIKPHHLAIVVKGRCGETCTFKDEDIMEKKLEVNAMFLDAEGEINMQGVLKLVEDLPEVVKTLPLKELQKLAKLLTKAMDVATSEIASEVGETAEAEAEPEVPIETSAEVEDAGEPEEEKKDIPMADSQEFIDAVGVAADKLNKTYAVVVAKAKDFLPSTYDFADKSADEIMGAALATQHADKFEDGELSTAFKLLKKNVTYENFGEETVDFVDELKDKEL